MLGLHIIVLALGLVQAATIFDCKGTCFGNAIEATKCSSRDTQCICLSQVFIESLSDCVQDTCTADGSAAAIEYAESFCKTVSGIQKRSQHKGFPWNHGGFPSVPESKPSLPSSHKGGKGESWVHDELPSSPKSNPSPPSTQKSGESDWSGWKPFPKPTKPKWSAPNKAWNQWQPPVATVW